MIMNLINIAYGEAAQDQFGADEAVQNQGSNHTNGQAASVIGDNVDAIQDSVNYGRTNSIRLLLIPLKTKTLKF